MSTQETELKKKLDALEGTGQGTTTYTEVIHGNDALTKNGGILILSDLNTYSGSPARPIGQITVKAGGTLTLQEGAVVVAPIVIEEGGKVVDKRGVKQGT